MSDETFADPEKPSTEDKAALEQEAAKIETKPADKAELEEAGEKPRDDKGKFVPHGALHEERERRKAAERERDLERAERQKERERIERLERRFSDLANPPKPPPDPRQDFDGYMEHKLQPIKQFVEETAKEKREREVRESQQRGQDEFKYAVLSREADFRKSAPDYDEAAEHWKSQRRADLIETGVDEEEAERAMNAELRWRAEKALQAGKNPAEVLYKLARSAGYQGKKPEADKSDEFEALERASKATKSLGSASGSAPSKMTAARIADMSDDEYAALRKKHSPDEIRRMMAS